MLERSHTYPFQGNIRSREQSFPKLSSDILVSLGKNPGPIRCFWFDKPGGSRGIVIAPLQNRHFDEKLAFSQEPMGVMGHVLGGLCSTDAGDCMARGHRRFH